MRFMMFMVLGEKARTAYEAGRMPTVEEVERMMVFNNKLIASGAMLAGYGFQPTSKSGRITFDGGQASAASGPFADERARIGGYWIIEAGSLDEAIDWAKQ